MTTYSHIGKHVNSAVTNLGGSAAWGVAVQSTLDAASVRRWSELAARSLADHSQEIDELNVFPVADADTGTNLAVTLRAAADALANSNANTAGAALASYARGAVLGASGNSGVIVSQLLRGIADVALGADHLDAKQLRAGLKRGVEQAYRAVAEPVEGTILTVARAAADARSGRGASLAQMVTAAVLAANEALQHTTEQLAALARACVVDAGGRGLVLVLDALARAITGASVSLPKPRRVARSVAVLRAAREGGGGFAYEVQYLLQASEPSVDSLRASLASMGDSVVVVGTGDGFWKVHAHVDDVGAAIEAGVEAGRPSDITVVGFADQTSAAAAEVGTAVVAMAPGSQLAHLFEAEGVCVVLGAVEGGAVSGAAAPGRGLGAAGPDGFDLGGTAEPARPTAADVVTAIYATGASAVVLLPNAFEINGVAEVAAQRVRAAGIRVAVIPTRSPVQGLAAVAVHDRGRAFDDDVVAMAEAAAATRFAAVAIADSEALTSVGICQAGDVLGMIDGEVVEIGHSLRQVAISLLDRLLGVGAELITVLLGVDAPADLGELLIEHVRSRTSLTEVSVYPGGQADFPLIIGVE